MPADHSSRRDGLWSARHRSLTLGLVLTITLVAFEALAVSTILPIVAQELGDRPLYGWVFSAFFLGNLLGIVLIGGTVDRGGLVGPFVLGLALFGVGLLGGGLAPSMPVLVAARFVQGLGGGAIPPIAYVAIGRSLDERLRATMFATLSTAWVLPGVVGPAIAGFVGEHVGWRVVFLGLIPLIALAGTLTFRPLARVAAQAEPGEGRRGSGAAPAGDPARPGDAGRAGSGAAPAGDPARAGDAGRAGDPARAGDAGRAGDADRRADAGRVGDANRRRIPGAILVALGAGLVTAGLTTASVLPGVPLLAAGIVVGLPAFRHLTPPGTLRAAHGLPAAVLLRGMLTFGFFCADAYVPLALQDWRGTSAAVSGIALTASTLSWTVGSWIQARWIERTGPRWFTGLGAATVTVGIVGFIAVLVPDVPLAIGIAAWAVAGLGMGLAYSALSLVVLADAPAGGEGAATSGLQLSDTLGTALGTGVGGALIAGAQGSGAPLWVGLGAAMLAGAGMTAAGALTSRRLPAPRPRRGLPASPAPG